MKLFSLKKQNNTTESTQEQASQLAKTTDPTFEKVSALDDGLHLGETANNTSTSAAKTPEMNDEFSLDTIDLNTLEDELLHGKTDYTKDAKTTETATQKELSFDDFDLDELLTDFEPKTTETTTTNTTQTANQAFTAATLNTNKEQEVDDGLTFDIDDFDNTPMTTKANTQVVETSTALASVNLDKKDSAPTVPIEPVITTTQTTETKVQENLLGNDLPLASNLKHDNFNGINVPPAFQKTAGKQPANLTSKKVAVKNPKQLYLLLGLVAVLAAAAWYFLGQSSDTATTTKFEPKTAVKPKPTTAAEPSIATPTITTQASSALPVASAVTADTASSSSTQATAVPIITPEEILKPTLPEDPAIAKEEMTRLSDQSAQLKEQEAMMEDQLRMMNELSSKKEERIKLLEQQVAQLEKQKAANK